MQFARVVTTFSVLFLFGCAGEVKTSSTAAQQVAAPSKTPEAAAPAQPEKTSERPAAEPISADDEALIATRDQGRSPESIADLKAAGNALFNGIMEMSEEKVLATFPSTPDVQKWVETLKFFDKETAAIFKEQVIKRTEKLPDLVRKELEKAKMVSEKLGIEWSKAEFVSSEPYEIKFETRGGYNTFKGMKIVFKVDDKKYAIEAGGGFQMNSHWRFFNPWKEIVKL